MKGKIAALAIASLMGLVSSARGDDRDSAARNEAKDLATRGDAEFGRGRCDRAITLWKQAESKFHAPTILVRIARCEALMGKVVAAAATLEAIASEKLPDDAPQPFIDARNDAIGELSAVRERIAELTVRTQAAGVDVTPTIEIDSVAGEAGQRVFRLDPGAHRVRVVARGGAWEQNVPLDEGQHRTIDVRLRAEAASPPSHTQRNIGFVVGGVGLASLVVGGIFGISAASTSSHLSDVCGADRGHCPQGEQGSIDRLSTNATVADITLVAGALLAIAGGVIVYTQPRPKKEPPRIRIEQVGMGELVGGW